MNAEHMACIEACSRCSWECEHCATACLKEPDVKAREKCIQMLRDCADICVLATQWMARGSSHAKALCNLCAEICEGCAVECAKFKDDHCQKCAQACRRCAEECRKMAREMVMA